MVNKNCVRMVIHLMLFQAKLNKSYETQHWVIADDSPEALFALEAFVLVNQTCRITAPTPRNQLCPMLITEY